MTITTRRLLLMAVTACSAAATEVTVLAAMRRFDSPSVEGTVRHRSGSPRHRLAHAILTETGATIESEFLIRRAPASASFDRGAGGQ